MILNRAMMCTKCVARRISFSPRRCAETSTITGATNSVDKTHAHTEFETVFTLPHIRYIAMFNRMKLYTAAGTVASVPGCGLLESLSIMSAESALAAAYIGVSSTALLSLVSLLTRNVIGFLYISTDDTLVKISTVDYWGLRRNKVVPVEDWVPLSSLPSHNTDPFYLTPELESSKTPMKLIVKLGKVLNKHKMAQLLE